MPLILLVIATGACLLRSIEGDLAWILPWYGFALAALVCGLYCWTKVLVEVRGVVSATQRSTTYITLGSASPLRGGGVGGGGGGAGGSKASGSLSMTRHLAFVLLIFFVFCVMVVTETVTLTTGDTVFFVWLVDLVCISSYERGCWVRAPGSLCHSTVVRYIHPSSPFPCQHGNHFVVELRAESRQSPSMARFAAAMVSLLLPPPPAKRIVLISVGAQPHGAVVRQWLYCFGRERTEAM